MLDDDLFRQVARHREVYFKQARVDYATLQRGRIQILPSPGSEREWRTDYEAMRAAMFVNEPPPFEEILASIRSFQDAFNRS